MRAFILQTQTMLVIGVTIMAMIILMLLVNELFANPPDWGSI